MRSAKKGEFLGLMCSLISGLFQSYIHERNGNLDVFHTDDGSVEFFFVGRRTLSKGKCASVSLKEVAPGVIPILVVRILDERGRFLESRLVWLNQGPGVYTLRVAGRRRVVVNGKEGRVVTQRLIKKFFEGFGPDSIYITPDGKIFPLYRVPQKKAGKSS